MKRKGLLGLVLPMVAMVAASCSLFGKKDNKKYSITFDISGGTKQEKEAILAAANGNLATAVGASTVSIKPGVVETLYEDEGTVVVLPDEKQGKDSKGDKHTVKFTWKLDTSSSYVDANNFIEVAAEKSHKLQINYKGWGTANKNGPDTTERVKFEIEKITCGGATATNPKMKYECKVQNALYYYKDVKIKDLNKVTDDKFDLVNYDQSSPYFKTHPENDGIQEKNYYYLNVPGKIIYYAPDGNWALLADGDQVIELYAGSALDLIPQHFPYMAQNDGWVVVSGNLAVYQGNIQVGYINKIAPLTDHSECTPPTMTYADLGDKLPSLKMPGQDYDKQAIDGFSNSLAQVTGTVSGLPSSISNARFTFKVTTDAGDEAVIAYDYHTDRDGSHGLYNKLKGLKNNDKVTIKGTMRYNNKAEKDGPFITHAGAEWNLVPFLAEHVA